MFHFVCSTNSFGFRGVFSCIIHSGNLDCVSIFKKFQSLEVLEDLSPAGGLLYCAVEPGMIVQLIWWKKKGNPKDNLIHFHGGFPLLNWAETFETSMGWKQDIEAIKMGYYHFQSQKWLHYVPIAERLETQKTGSWRLMFEDCCSLILKLPGLCLEAIREIQRHFPKIWSYSINIPNLIPKPFTVGSVVSGQIYLDLSMRARLGWGSLWNLHRVNGDTYTHIFRCFWSCKHMEVSPTPGG